MNAMRTFHPSILRRGRTLALLALALASALPAFAQYSRRSSSRGDDRSRSRSEPTPSRTASTNAPGVRDLAFFQLITDRNIFDPTRVPTRRQTYTMPVAQAKTYARNTYFTLVGIMEYEKGPFAFFDGTTYDLRKVVKLRDTNTIAGFKVAEITRNGVKLRQETNTYELRVGMLMRRTDAGGWVPAEPADGTLGNPSSGNYNQPTGVFVNTPAPAAASEGPGFPTGEGGPPIVIINGPDGTPVPVDASAAAPAGAPAGAPAAAAPAAAPAAAGGSPSDVLQRLMQRRAQEMNR
jgi:hypothetical protein